MFSRPKAEETEEDILKLQEEFLKKQAESKIKLAASVVHRGKDENRKTHRLEIDPNVNLQEQIANTFESVPIHYQIGDVIERKPPPTKIIKLPGRTRIQLKRRDVTLSDTKSRNKTGTASTTPTNVDHIYASDSIDDIDKENKQILSQMTQEEISEERERLLSTLDPAIVAFLKSKHENSSTNQTISIEQQNKAAESIRESDVDALNDIISHPDANNWLNFNKVERSKMTWMSHTDIPKFEKGLQYEARFDFNGFLLPFSKQKITESDRALYHHGEEPGRPGYSLQELFQLCRSSVNQQKIMALNTLANILSVFQSGVYDDLNLNVPYEQTFFVLRFCLDDNVPAVLNACTKAMRNLFYYIIDETCLDNLLGFGLGLIQPILAVDNSEHEDDPTVNDQQLAETNLVKCLIRTDILKRIRYILSTVRPSQDTVMYCIEILIRLARDSNYVADLVFKSENLLKCIFDNFLPLNYQSGFVANLAPYKNPLVQAIKLCRILAARHQSYATVLINSCNIIDVIHLYVSNEALSLNYNGLKLQIECMHLWCVLLRYSLTQGQFKNFQPILLRMLDFHSRNTNIFDSTLIIQAHVAALLNLITESCNCDPQLVANFVPFLLNIAAPKWIKQFCLLNKCKTGEHQIIASLIKCLMSLAVKYKGDEMENIQSELYKMLCSKGFECTTDTLALNSNLLSPVVTHKSGSNLKSVEVVSWENGNHVIPVMQSNSGILLMNIISEFVAKSPHSEIKLHFVNHPNVRKYLECLKEPSRELASNWFTQIETELIANILKIAVDINSGLDTALFYEIAVQSLCTFTYRHISYVHFILTHIVFNLRFYPVEVLMENVEITEQNVLLKEGLSNLERNILPVYIRVLNLNAIKNREDLSLEANIGSLIPVDWIYVPIILLYSNQQQQKFKMLETEQVSVITNCLRWIHIYKTFFPALTKVINPTDSFCRISCTFLASDSLFLNPEIRGLLESCLKSILSSGEDLNFNKPIHGLINFQDFYTQLVEHYQAVSYSDVLFGNFILIPLMQKQDVKYRKLLWSEYAGAVQIFNVTKGQVLCPTELFLEPPETDVSLLKCYENAIKSGCLRQHSFLYEVALHHVRGFIRYKKDNAMDTV